MDKINMDDGLLKSYFKVALYTRMMNEKYHKKLKGGQVKPHMIKLGKQLHKILKQNKCFQKSYKIFTGQQLKDKYKVKINKKQLKKIDSLIRKIKSISPGITLKQKSSYIRHNIFIKL